MVFLCTCRLCQTHKQAHDWEKINKILHGLNFKLEINGLRIGYKYRIFCLNSKSTNQEAIWVESIWTVNYPYSPSSRADRIIIWPYPEIYNNLNLELFLFRFQIQIILVWHFYTVNPVLPTIENTESEDNGYIQFLWQRKERKNDIPGNLNYWRMAYSKKIRGRIRISKTYFRASLWLRPSSLW